MHSKFDPYKDKFWVDSDASRFVVISGNTLAGYYELDNDKFSYASIKGLYSLYTNSKEELSNGVLLDCNVFWGANKTAFLWVDRLTYDNAKKVTTVYALKDKLVSLLTINEASYPLLSPDGKMIAFSAGKSLYIYERWEFVKDYRYSVLFTSDNFVCIHIDSPCNIVVSMKANLYLLP